MSDAHDDRDAPGGPGSEPPPPDETTRLPAAHPDEEPADRTPGGDEPTTVLPGRVPGDEPTTVLPGGPGDRPTSALPPYGAVPPDDDRTRAMPPVDGPDDDRTSVLPPQDVWTGRAGVPSRDGGPMRDATPPPGIEYGEGERTWRAPLIIAGIVLLLLLLFGVAAWFALRGAGPTPEPSASPSPVVTSAAPTSAVPSPSPTPSPVPSLVAVPDDLIGMTEQEAIDALTAVGLNPRISLRPTDEADPGTVVDVDPESGTELAPGESVQLVIAVAPSSPSPSPSPSPEPSPSPSPEEE